MIKFPTLNSSLAQVCAIHRHEYRHFINGQSMLAAIKILHTQNQPQTHLHTFAIGQMFCILKFFSRSLQSDKTPADADTD